MPVSFDPIARRIVLDGDVSTARDLYSRWKEWAQEGDNAKFPPAFSTVGGEPLGGGRFVAAYFFLLNGWRVRPREADHTLIVDGNLGVEGGGDPIVPTLGSFRVLVQYTVPVQAQGIATSGSIGPTAEQIAQEVRQAIEIELARIDTTISSRASQADVFAA